MCWKIDASKTHDLKSWIRNLGDLKLTLDERYPQSHGISAFLRQISTVHANLNDSLPVVSNAIFQLSPVLHNSFMI